MGGGLLSVVVIVPVGGLLAEGPAAAPRPGTPPAARKDRGPSPGTRAHRARVGKAKVPFPRWEGLGEGGGGEPQPPARTRFPAHWRGSPRGRKAWKRETCHTAMGEGLGVQKTPALAEGPPHPQKTRAWLPRTGGRPGCSHSPCPSGTCPRERGRRRRVYPGWPFLGQGGRGQQEAEDPKAPCQDPPQGEEAAGVGLGQGGGCRAGPASGR